MSHSDIERRHLEELDALSKNHLEELDILSKKHEDEVKEFEEILSSKRGLATANQQYDLDEEEGTYRMRTYCSQQYEKQCLIEKYEAEKQALLDSLPVEKQCPSSQ